MPTPPPVKKRRAPPPPVVAGSPTVNRAVVFSTPPPQRALNRQGSLSSISSNKASNLDGKKGENRTNLSKRRNTLGTIRLKKKDLARLQSTYAENQRIKQNAVRGTARALGYSRRLAIVMWAQIHSKPGSYTAFSPFPILRAQQARQVDDGADIDHGLPIVIQNISGIDGWAAEA